MAEVDKYDDEEAILVETEKERKSAPVRPSAHRLCRGGIVMEMCYITFRSVTYAQRGEQVLRWSGLSCNVQRTPKWMEEQGCGYCLRLRREAVRRAAEILQQSKVPFRKIYIPGADGAMREMVL